MDRAIEIAEAAGEKGLTMRAVAEACGVTPMALYHHVADKDELLGMMVDRVVGRAIERDDRGPVEGDPTSWRRELVDLLCRYRQGFLDNPVAASVYLRRPALSPNLARVTEAMFELLRRGGFTGAAMAGATDALVLLTAGSISNDLSRPPEIRHQLLGQVPEEEVPLLTEVIETYAGREPQQRFRVAVDALLDGLQAGLSTDRG